MDLGYQKQTPEEQWEKPGAVLAGGNTSTLEAKAKGSSGPAWARDREIWATLG